VALHPELELHLRRVVKPDKYTVTGNKAELAETSTDLSPQRLLELIEVATQLKHEVRVVSGKLTIKPR
jgi:hypothetical protein